ncbi:MAG: TonB-dependent receptor [Tannerella sp.]|nr:TonB-dependent receptor [Tannerella sp.]
MMSRKTKNKLQKGLLALCMCIMSLSVFAQGRQVTGVITDVTGESVIGVNVLVKGTTNGAITDLDGNYTIQNVENNAILVVSYIGYLTQEIPVGNQSVINVLLKEDTQSLEEVVVIGYGVQKKSDLTGAIGSVDNEKLVAKGSTTVMESLQGQVAGVDISQSSSRAGEKFSIQIRGKSSLQGGDPLYVVDGVVTNDINFLNPSDIEKIDILKDASSTAIYGSRATNGVVMVTTKQAKSGQADGRVSVSYDGYVGMKTVARMPDFMDDAEWMDFRYMKYTTPVKDASKNYVVNNGKMAMEMTNGNLLSVWNDKGNDISYKMREQYQNRDFTDWRDLMLSDGIQQNHFINVAGNSKSTSYRLGMGYQQEEGVMGDSYDRFNIKAAIDGKISNTVTAGITANMAVTNNDFGSQRAVQEAFRANGYWLPYNTETGEVNYMPGKDLAPGQETSLTFPAGFSSSVSPLIDKANSKDETKTYDVLANVYLQFQPIEEVIFKTTFSPTYRSSRRGEFYGGLSSMRSSTYNATSAPNGESLATVTKKEWLDYTWDTQANYVKTFGDHNINAMGLFSMYRSEFENYGYSAVGVLPGTDWYNMGSGSSIQSPASGYSEISMLSYALRLNYGYKGKYLATVSSRWDGSSKFQKGNKWGAFPSMALAWRISEEDFMTSTSWISNLKLRASLGYTGNNAVVGAYDTQSLASTLYYYGFGSTIAKGYGPNGLVNEGLTWEKTTELNLGLDFGFLDGRISGSIDWYNKDSKDLLMQQKLLIEQGAYNKDDIGTMWANIGKVRNTGLEVVLKTINVSSKDWYWETVFSFATNKNKVLELQNGKEDMRAQRWFIGQPIDVIFDLEEAGICTKEMASDEMYQKYGYFEGSMTYVDQNNDGKIDDQDRVILGHKLPTWTGNFSTTVAWKNWDFSMSIYTKQGSKTYSPFMDEFTDYSDRGRTKLSMDFYIPEGAPIFNTYVDANGLLQSDPTKVATSAKYGSYPYPTNDAAINHGGGNGWRTGKNTEFNSNGVVNNSFVKIKNITVGYTFPKNLLGKANIQSLRIYANVLNPFTFTNYKGFDPEWADAEINDGTGGPSSITYQIGLNVKF